MRLRTGHTPDSWQDLGPSAARPAPRASLYGSLVVSGKSTGPVMNLWPHRSSRTPDEIAEAKRRYIGHLGKNA